LRDARLVLEHAAQVVGAKEGLTRHVSDKRLLLVLDNFEQVVDAGRDVATLVDACPGLNARHESRSTACNG
jgi:predicted ATPase